MKTHVTIGDIIVFKAGTEDWISKSIAWFSGTDTSHASLLYCENTIAELINKGAVTRAVEIKDGDEAYVMRRRGNLDITPVLDTATSYLNAKTRYDFPALAILAGLFLYRKIQPSKTLLAIGSKVLMCAGYALDKMIQEIILKKTDRPMVCSQFVYQVYYDCGKDYRIDIDYQYQNPKLPQLQNNLSANNDWMDHTICLADMLTKQHDTMNDSAIIPKDAIFDNMSSYELLAQEFYHAISFEEDLHTPAANHDSISAAPTLSYDEVLNAGKYFIDKLKILLRELSMDIPIDSLFVTPGDLVYHAKNLDFIQKIDLKRI